MTETTKDILKQMNYDINDIHHAEYIYTYPENWIKITHYQGEEVKRNWLIKKIFGPKYYKNTMCYDTFRRCTCTLDEVIRMYGNDNKRYYNKEDDVYPIYYYNAIHIYTKNKYGNPNNCSTCWYIGWLDKNEMLDIINDINNSIIE